MSVGSVEDQGLSACDVLSCQTLIILTLPHGVGCNAINEVQAIVKIEFSEQDMNWRFRLIVNASAGGT